MCAGLYHRNGCFYSETKKLPEERFSSKVCAVAKLYIFSVVWQAVILCPLHSCWTPGSWFAWRIISWNLLLGHLHQGSGMTQKKNTRSWYWSGASSRQNCTSFHCYTSGFGSDPSVRKLMVWNKTSMTMWIPFWIATSWRKFSSKIDLECVHTSLNSYSRVLFKQMCFLWEEKALGPDEPVLKACLW